LIRTARVKQKLGRTDQQAFASRR